METPELTSNNYFKSLKIIHIALVAGLIIFLASVIFVVNEGFVAEKDPGLNEIFSFLVPVFVAGGIISSIFIYKNRINIIKKKNSLKTKLTEHTGALILRYALLEGPAFLAIIVLMLTSNMFYASYPVLLILLMAWWRPSKNNIIQLLELNPEEIQILESPEKIIN